MAMILPGAFPGGILMPPLLPPSLAEMRQNLSLIAADWRAGSGLARYFMASQLVSGFLLLACSLVSMGAGMAGDPRTSLLALVAASVCFVQSLGAFSVLKRRFQVRYEVW